MEQRRLRLGDILDDYCPRERRVTNHAVVAMIEEDIKQTRCTTCDAEHAYKGARVPKRRKKETPAALYKEVLAGMPEADAAPVLAPQVKAAHPAPLDEPDLPPGDVITPVTETAVSFHPLPEELDPPMHSDDSDHRDDVAETAASGDDQVPVVDGPVHRPLIRATLPRPEGQKDARPVPEFTVRHAPGRSNGHGNGQGGFRGERVRMRAGNGQGSKEPNGNRAPSNGSRFHGQRPGGSSRQPSGRPGASGPFRNGGPSGKRGRGSRG